MTERCQCGAVFTVPGESPAAKASLDAKFRDHRARECPARGGETK